MTLGRPILPIELIANEKKQLKQMANSRSHPHGLVRRAKIVLLAADVKMGKMVKH